MKELTTYENVTAAYADWLKQEGGKLPLRVILESDGELVAVSNLSRGWDRLVGIEIDERRRIVIPFARGKRYGEIPELSEITEETKYAFSLTVYILAKSLQGSKDTPSLSFIDYRVNNDIVFKG
ncbi:MAG: hypothetical protein IKL29_08885, partial [Bacteroidaceae bacterium]|nr:hypothetical protein [Bacteroidaceae bacterium]